eukprot:189374-Prorocentrum_minimum.AAC.3
MRTCSLAPLLQLVLAKGLDVCCARAVRRDVEVPDHKMIHCSSPTPEETNRVDPIAHPVTRGVTCGVVFCGWVYAVGRCPTLKRSSGEGPKQTRVGVHQVLVVGGSVRVTTPAATTDPGRRFLVDLGWAGLGRVRLILCGNAPEGAPQCKYHKGGVPEGSRPHRDECLLHQTLELLLTLAPFIRKPKPPSAAPSLTNLTFGRVSTL